MENVSQVWIAAHLCASLFVSSPCWAEPRPEQINQPLSDEFGVERKTGRPAFPLPVLLANGGAGPGAIAIGYNHENGSNLSLSGWPSFVKQEVFPPVGPNLSYVPRHPNDVRYLRVTITFGGIRESFRKLYAVPGGYSKGTWEPEYPTGSTYDGAVFVDKYGMKITEGTASNRLITRVEYPSGLTKEFSSAGVRNNMGYAIERDQAVGEIFRENLVNAFIVKYQAVNLAIDSCDLFAALLCTGLSAVRSGSFQGTLDTSGARAFRDKFLMTDADGRITEIRNVLISAYRWPPRCSARNQGVIVTCEIPPLSHREYPAGITYPGSKTEDHTFSYVSGIRPGVIGPSHDDIRISQATKAGITATYETTRNAPAETYGGYGPSWVRIRSLIGGQEVSYSEAFQLYPWWGQSRTVVTHTTDGLLRRTSYGYDSLFEVNGVVAPEGNGFAHQFDARHNITSTTYSPKTGSTDPAQVVTYSYAATCTAGTQAICNKPLTITDRRGRTTNYEYNQFGQLTKEIAPAPTPGSARPTTINEYTLRTAYIKDSSGNPVAAGPPISMLTRSFTCISSANCSASTAAADKVVTDYDYGPTSGLNNLLLRGVAVTAINSTGQIETRRTCYSYNYFGERISETLPNAGLSSCPA